MAGTSPAMTRLGAKSSNFSFEFTPDEARAAFARAGRSGGMVLRIALAEAADAADVGHALLVGDEEAVDRAFGVVGAPGIVLGLGAGGDRG